MRYNYLVKCSKDPSFPQRSFWQRLGETAVRRYRDRVRGNISSSFRICILPLSKPLERLIEINRRPSCPLFRFSFLPIQHLLFYSALLLLAPPLFPTFLRQPPPRTTVEPCHNPFPPPSSPRFHLLSASQLCSNGVTGASHLNRRDVRRNGAEVWVWAGLVMVIQRLPALRRFSSGTGR